MPQLTEDEWPADHQPTTHEQQVERDPIAGPKDPHDERRPWPNENDGARHRGRDQVRREAEG